MAALTAQELMQRCKSATPTVVPKIANGIPGGLGLGALRHAAAGPNNDLVPYTPIRLVVGQHDPGLGQT